MNETIRPAPTPGPRAAAADSHVLPAWYDEVDSALSYAAHLICAGNVRDIYPDPAGQPGVFSGFIETLWQLVSRRGVAALLVFDPVGGLKLHPGATDAARRTLAEAGLIGKDGRIPLSDLADLGAAVLAFEAAPVALAIDYASHLPGTADFGAADLFVALHRAARRARPRRSTRDAALPPYNPIVWIADRPGDLPDWFAVDNPLLRGIAVERPDIEDRLALALRMGRGLVARSQLGEDEAMERLQRFALECEGDSLMTVRHVLSIARTEGMGAEGLTDALRSYRTGLRRNPWASPVLKARIRTAPERLGGRILCQPHAIDKTLDILSRSIMGLSGVQDGRRFARPRGVLFFAGPTGVGKTELAKAVTDLLFGHEAACHRFDMSEFMEEGSITRLIGAPPGQPGHDRGGELVNAAQRRPFSVFLFDEIEKAHPRILDVFLQILDEGRLTDARGATGHFSEALIIFTSNIGMLGNHRETNMGMDVMPSDDYRQLDEKISHAVQQHFRFTLKRPELINRIGQNIVVFDFLRHNAVSAIFDTVLSRVIGIVEAEHGVTVSLSEAAHATLRTLCTHDVFDGGRGVGNRIETHFVNPLARALFRGDAAGTARIERIAMADGHTTLIFDTAGDHRTVHPRHPG